MLEVTETGAVETARRIARGETTALAECEAAIARIEERDGPINAVVVRDFDRAREAAKAADAALAAGEAKPLLGVPMTVKESNDVAGLPSSWGLEQFRDNIAEKDSPPVAKLKDAGAIILGKTNVPVMLTDWQAVNPVYGRTNNPHNLDRVPGGSSGGAAAALASGMVPLELGSDIGGSIRVPASYCGVYGLKTSYGIVGLEGHYFPGMDGADIPLSVVGPMARAPEDIAVALDIVSQIALPRPRKRKLGECRLLLVTDAFAADDSVVAAIEDAAKACENAGATVERKSDLLPDLGALHGQYVHMLLTVLAARDPGIDIEMPLLPAWLDMLDAQARAQRQWRTLFEEYDAVLAPVAGTTAFPHDPKGMEGRLLTINGEQVPFGAQFGWIGIATYPGLPAISAPVGEDADGLPIGLQIVGPMHGDHDVVEIARLIGELG
jgi:amidase